MNQLHSSRALGPVLFSRPGIVSPLRGRLGLAQLGLVAALLVLAGCSKLNNKPFEQGDGGGDAQDGGPGPTTDARDMASRDVPGTLDAPAVDAPGLDAPGLDVPVTPDAGPAVDAAPTSLETGQACNADTTCKSGFCVDGVCCESRCNGACTACGATLTGKPNGTCAPVSSGLDPHDSCQASAGETCGNDGFCDGAGACRKYGSSQICAAASCSGSTFLGARTCDGKGACAAGTSTSCSTSPCTLTGCAAPCTKDTDCSAVMASSYCDAGTCKAKKSNGDVCGLANECSSGLCADGFCCNAKCDGKCQACSNKKTGQANGQCAAVPAGQDPDSECPVDAANPCGFVGCNGAGACQYKAAGSACGNASCSTPNNYTPAATCNGSGTCATSSAQVCSGGYTCASATACKTTCTTASDCAGTTNYCSGGKCVAKKGAGVTCSAGSECGTGFCSGDGHCCNTACNGSGGCQSCTTGTCSTSSGLTVCPSTNQCVNTGTDTKNCGTCGKVCSSMTSNNGVAKCSIGSCVPGCASGYRLCANGGGPGKYSCVNAVWDMELTNGSFPHTCTNPIRFVGDHVHSGNQAVEATGTGDSSYPECVRVTNDNCSTDPDGIGPLPGSTVSAWVLTTVASTTCYFDFDGAATSTAPKAVPQGTWTQLSWVVPQNADVAAPSLMLRCDLAAGATFYVDDISLTQP